MRRMRMKTKGLCLVAMVSGLAVCAPAQLEATVADPAARDDQVMVVNNHGWLVNVYAEDASGRMHKLGRVASGDARQFEIPPQIAEGSFRVKVYPSFPPWSLNQDDFGVKTNPLDFDRDSQITFWLEPDLTKSVLQVAR